MADKGKIFCELRALKYCLLSRKKAIILGNQTSSENVGCVTVLDTNEIIQGIRLRVLYAHFVAIEDSGF